ncbi:MAG: glycosyltransferase family 9 protein [Candidatus Omnitrophica bacterium]|nr:glycosyltransferase family 9 protein [Candidatus Omnitrophota bacterium]
MFNYVFKRKKTWISVFILDLIGGILFFFKSKERPKKVERILVIRLDHLGDVVMATPFLTRLREAYPAAEIHLLTDENHACLFERDSRLDQVIGVKNHWFSRKAPVRWFSMFQLAMSLRKMNYDLGFDLRGDARTIFFFLFLSGVRFRVSYGVRGGGFLVHLAPLYPPGTHESERNIHLLSAFLNRQYEATPARLELVPLILQNMQAKLDKLGKSREKKLIAAHLGAGYPSKQWGIEKYQRVLELILDSENYQICLVGQKEEVPLPEDFLKQEGVLNFLGATTLAELAAVLSLCDYFIGNDSGPAHMASAVGVPVLSVFSGTNRAEEFRPLAGSSEIVHKDLDCSPCEEQICPLRHHHCMSLITEDEVLDAFKKLAAHSSPSSRVLR